MTAKSKTEQFLLKDTFLPLFLLTTNLTVYPPDFHQPLKENKIWLSSALSGNLERNILTEKETLTKCEKTKTGRHDRHLNLHVNWLIHSFPTTLTTFASTQVPLSTRLDKDQRLDKNSKPLTSKSIFTFWSVGLDTTHNQSHW